MSPPNGVRPGTEEKYIPIPTSQEEAETAEAEDSGGVTRHDAGDSKADPEVDSDSTTSADPEVVVPPDGGWGWFVVAASFFCNMVVDGIIFCFGMLREGIETEFTVGKAQLALVGSLMSGFYLMVGPFASALANRYGFRLVAIVGSVLSALAFVLSYFATSVTFLCISYGLLGGIGFGFIYVPAVITVGFYFEKWRALATGIGVCGSGIGNFLFAPLFSFLVNKWGWRCCLLVQAGMSLSCVLFGLFFRPLKPRKVKDIKQEQPELIMDKNQLPPETRMKMEMALKHLKSNAVHLSHSTITRILGANNNSDYPTIADVYHTINVPRHDRIKKEKRFSDPFAEEKDGEPLLENRTIQVIIQKKLNDKRQRTTSDSSNPRSRKNTLSEVNRPLYRDDIFFAASLTRLPQYTSKTSLEYNLAVTRLPTKEDIDEEKKSSGCKLCPMAMRRTLATMLDFSLLKSPTFLVLALSGAFTMMGFYVPFMYLKERAEKKGLDDVTTTWLISAIGIANTIGRIMCGGLSFFPKISTLWVNNIALTIGGLATMLSGLSGTAEYQFFYSVVFGLAISCFASLRSILVVELLGLAKLTNAFGLLLLFQGIAAAIGSPMAGAFMEATQNYDAAFYLSGSLLLMSALVCYPLGCINRWENRRNKAIKSVPV